MLLNLIEQYIFHLSIFYCKDMDLNDNEFKSKVMDLEKYIREKVGDKNV